MKSKTLITSVTGQDGAYLSEFLLGKGYEVYGPPCRISVPFLILVSSSEFGNSRIRSIKLDPFHGRRPLTLMAHHSFRTVREWIDKRLGIFARKEALSRWQMREPLENGLERR